MSSGFPAGSAGSVKSKIYTTCSCECICLCVGSVTACKCRQLDVGFIMARLVYCYAVIKEGKKQLVSVGPLEAWDTIAVAHPAP